MSNQELIQNFVYGKLMQLKENKHESSVSGTLAVLRRGIGKEPGSQPELWAITLNGLPEELQGKGTQASFGERAVHAVFTLYALHQQGKNIRELCMNEAGNSLGQAMRQFIQREPSRESATTKRFLKTVTAESFEELSWHLRGLIQLLRSKDISLDYAMLAYELYQFQFTGSKDQIRLRWGRQFHWFQPTEQKQ